MRRRTGGELPPRDPFVEKALEECRQRDDPQEPEAVGGPGHRGRDDVAGADAGRCNQQTRPDQPDDAGGGGRPELASFVPGNIATTRRIT